MTTYDELRSTVEALEAEIAELAATPDITPEQDARLDEALADHQTRAAELAKLEEQHGKASEATQAEITALRANIDKLEFAKPEEAPGVMGFESGADIAKALDAAEFDRMIRTVRENVPGGERPSAAPATRCER